MKRRDVASARRTRPSARSKERSMTKSMAKRNPPQQPHLRQRPLAPAKKPRQPLVHQPVSQQALPAHRPSRLPALASRPPVASRAMNRWAVLQDRKSMNQIRPLSRRRQSMRKVKKRPRKGHRIILIHPPQPLSKWWRWFDRSFKWLFIQSCSFV